MKQILVLSLGEQHNKALSQLRTLAQARGWERSSSEPFWFDDLSRISPEAAAFVLESTGWMEEVTRQMSRAAGTAPEEMRLQQGFGELTQLLDELQNEANEAVEPKGWIDNLALRIWKKKATPLPERISSALQKKQQWLTSARSRLGQIRDGIALRDQAEAGVAMSIDLLHQLGAQIGTEKAYYDEELKGPERFDADYLEKVRRREALERALETTLELGARLQHELNVGRATAAMLDMAHHKEQKNLSEMEVALAQQEMHLVSLQTATQSLKTGDLARELQKTASEQSNQALMALARMARNEHEQQLNIFSMQQVGHSGGKLKPKDREFLLEIAHQKDWTLNDWTRLKKLEIYLPTGGRSILKKMCEEFTKQPGEVQRQFPAWPHQLANSLPRAFFVHPDVRQAYAQYVAAACRYPDFWAEVHTLLPVHGYEKVVADGLIAKGASWTIPAVPHVKHLVADIRPGEEPLLQDASLPYLVGKLDNPELELLAGHSWKCPEDRLSLAAAFTNMLPTHPWRQGLISTLVASDSGARNWTIALVAAHPDVAVAVWEGAKNWTQDEDNLKPVLQWLAHPYKELPLQRLSEELQRFPKLTKALAPAAKAGLEQGIHKEALFNSFASIPGPVLATMYAQHASALEKLWAAICGTEADPAALLERGQGMAALLTARAQLPEAWAIPAGASGNEYTTLEDAAAAALLTQNAEPFRPFFADPDALSFLFVLGALQHPQHPEPSSVAAIAAPCLLELDPKQRQATLARLPFKLGTAVYAPMDSGRPLFIDMQLRRETEELSKKLEENGPQPPRGLRGP